MQIVKADAPVTPTVVPFKDKTVRGKLWAILPWVVFGLACVLVVVGMIVHYGDGLDDEMASELILAKMLSEGKGFILTNQWLYSTEIRFLNTQLIFAPLFWLFKSWAVVRIVGSIILNGIMLLAFYFLLASLRRKAVFPWLASLLILPTSFHNAHIINFGVYYIPHIAISFTMLTLTFYALRPDASKKRFWCLVGGGALLSLLAAIGGFRQVMVLSIPLFAAAVIYWLMNLATEHKSTALKFLTVSGIGLGTALVGLFVNAVILQNYFSFKNFGMFDGWRDGYSFQYGVNIALGSVMGVLGWLESDTWYGATTFSNLVAVLILFLFIVAVNDIIKHHKRYAAGVVQITLFTLCAVVIFIGICVLTTLEIQKNHALPVTVFFLPIIAFYLTQNWQWQVLHEKWQIYVKPALGVVAMVLILTSGLMVGCQFYFANQFPWHNAKENASLSIISTQLLAEGYTQGYCITKYGNSSGGEVLTEFSNGKIEVWCLSTNMETLDAVTPWRQSTEHLNTQPTGKVFFLFTWEENERLVIPQKFTAADAPVFYADQYYVVYVFDDLDAARAIVG